MRLYGSDYSRQDLLSRIGSIDQVGGIRVSTLADGNERGVRVADFDTGTGFRFSVLLDRGMDIGPASHCGLPLTWRSPTGAVSPAYYEPAGLGFLRSFHGGLMVTCGLTYLGAPCEDQGESLGLHGRVSHIPAGSVSVDGAWQGDEYHVWCEGKMREAAVFGPNLLLRRRIDAKMGESRLTISDRVENCGYETTPHMILYHCNFGFPLVAEGTELLAPSLDVRARDGHSAGGLGGHAVMDPPAAGYVEQVFYHDMEPDSDGMVTVALVNRHANGGCGFGAYVRYRKAELPCFVQWKMMGRGTYVVGLEPGNSLVEGRSVERERGTLRHIDPGESIEYHVEIGVLASQEEIGMLTGARGR